MGARLILLACVAACVRVASPPAGESPQRPEEAGTAPASGPLAAAPLELDVHHLVNAHRVARGLAPLAWDDRLAGIAREHSAAMARGGRPFGHEGFDTRAARIAEAIQVRAIAENVAYDSRAGAELARLVVAGWIDSPGHRANIEGEFTAAGVGSASRSDGLRYFTHIFVRAPR